MAKQERTTSESRAAKVLVGPAGWSYPEWRGVVYPTEQPSGLHGAAYLAEYFSVLEINTSFYNAIRPEVSRVWAQKLSEINNFEFTAKLQRDFTHGRDLDPAKVLRFREGLEPLIDASLLGCLLAQFPASFRLDAANLAYVSRLARAFRDYPLVAEFRHASWNNSRALAALAEMGVGFCNIDQPQIHQHLPPTEHVTAPISYVRLHGRNYEQGAGGDYSYSTGQLATWRARVERIAASSRKVYVVANNHVGGQSVANALQMAALLRREKVEVPTTLLERMPHLQRIASNQPAQRTLFFDIVRETRDSWRGLSAAPRFAAAGA